MRVEINERGIEELKTTRGMNTELYAWATKAKFICMGDKPHRTGHYHLGLYTKKGRGVAVYGSHDFKAWWIEFGTGEPYPTKALHPLTRAAELLGLRVEAKHR